MSTLWQTSNLKKARQIAIANSLEAGIKHKLANDVTAKPHNILEGDMIFVNNQLFLGKNKTSGSGSETGGN